MAPGAPCFAITGRGNDVKTARDLISSIGGVLTTREQTADYLVVVKGAGRRKVEEFCHQQYPAKRGSVPAGGTNDNDNDMRGVYSQLPGCIVLLDMLREWSAGGKAPRRHVSMEELEEMNLFGAHRGQRSYPVPEGFLKRSRLTSDAQGNPVDKAGNASLIPPRGRAAPQASVAAEGASSSSSSLVPSSLPPGSFPTSVPLAGPAVFRTSSSSVTVAAAKPKHSWLLLGGDDSPPQKSTAAQEGEDAAPVNGGGASQINRVVNPMRDAFHKRAKPDWDTYFTDPPAAGGGNKNSTNTHVDPRGMLGATATAPFPSYSKYPSKKTTPPSVRPADPKKKPLSITKAKKNSVSMTFDFTKSSTQKSKAAKVVSGDPCNNNNNNSSGANDNGNDPKKSSNEKAIVEEETRERRQKRKLRPPQWGRPQQSPADDTASVAKPDEFKTLEWPTSRQSRVSSEKPPAMRVGCGSGVLAGDGTFGTPPPLPPRPRESWGSERSTGGVTITGPTGRKSAPATTRTGRPSSTAPNPSTSYAAVKKTNNNGNNDKTSTASPSANSNPLMKRVRQSSYCKGIPDETCMSVLQQVVDRACPVSFNGIAGLEECKRILYEAIILPAKCPQLFTGLRKPCSGLLLFGPPGNGKTLLANAVAKECDTTFFSISAAAITSKWVGESEKMVRALFAVARALAPSTIFVDEIDALLQARGGSHEGEGSRRIKTEFLVQMDGAGNDTSEARVLVMGATNRPFDLDEAIIRRFPKRVFVPLPDAPARTQILQSLLSTEETPNNFTPAVWRRFVAMTEGYSGHDLRQLCEEAAMVPVRELLAEKVRSGEDLTTQAYHNELLRPLTLQDVEACAKARHPSCCPKLLNALREWSDTYGSR